MPREAGYLARGLNQHAGFIAINPALKYKPVHHSNPAYNIQNHIESSTL